MNLFLDDIRIPRDAAGYIHPYLAILYVTQEWKVVKSYDEFVDWITNHELPNLISFDHDLADIHYSIPNKDGFSWTEYYKDENREMTGYDCAKWLVDYCMDNKLPIPEFIVHSMNTVGAENIINYLNNAKKHLNNVQ